MKGPFGSPILDAACRLMVPFILVFAIYVIFHGHYSPGGGFQGGVICAVSVIVMRLVFGSHVSFGPSRATALAIACSGVLLYLCIGLVPLFYGGGYLDYGLLPINLPTNEVRALGTLGIEIGVGVAVTGTMLVIYDAITSGTEDEPSW